MRVGWQAQGDVRQRGGRVEAQRTDCPISVKGLVKGPQLLHRKEGEKVVERERVREGERERSEQESV